MNGNGTTATSTTLSPSVTSDPRAARVHQATQRPIDVTRIADQAAYLYVVLWLLEGALRKWGPGELGTPLYFLRDGLVLGALLLVFVLSAPKRRPPIALVIAEVVVLGLAALQLVVLASPVPVAVVGVRQFLGPLFFFHLVYAYCSAHVLGRMAQLILLFAPVEAGLALLQALSPAQSWVNKVGPDAYIQIYTSNNVVRASGTFTAAYGLVSYLMIAVPLALTTDRRSMPSGSLRRLILRTATPLLMLTCLVCGSRSAVFIGVVMIALRIGAPRTRSGDGTASRLVKMLLALGCGAAIAVSVAPQVLSAFQQRASDAERSEGFDNRLKWQAFTYLGELPEMTPLGDGLGGNSMAGIAAGSRAPWVENEPARWIREGGLVGLGAVLLRIVLSPILIVWTWRRARRTGDVAPFLFGAILGINMIGSTLNTQPSQQGCAAMALVFAVLGTGVRREEA
jgi:hypothetical protein